MTPNDETSSPSSPAARRRRARAREQARRRRSRRRRALLAGSLVALLGVLAVVVLRPAQSGTAGAPTGGRRPGRARPSRFAVGLRVVRFTDPTRTITAPGGPPRPRTLVTDVRYPAVGRPTNADLPDAAPARAAAPFPLIVFGHGFALTPAFYSGLLRAWARAGYVVAAPAFPLENGDAPGGPDEADLVNQPADMRLVISRMLAPSEPFAGLVDARRIAVAGHSDGGDTALAVAYGRAGRDPRVGAVVVLAGAELPGGGGLAFGRHSAPLFAVQGTADAVNPSPQTDSFYRAASRPKFRLRLLGAAHLPPYSAEEPQLGIVEATTTAFLDGYLNAEPAARAGLTRIGSIPGVARLDAVP